MLEKQPKWSWHIILVCRAWMILCNAINGRLQVFPLQSHGVANAYPGLIYQEKKKKKRERSAKLLHLYWPNHSSRVGISSFVQSTSLLSSKSPFSHGLLFIRQIQSPPWVFPFLSVAFYPHPLVFFFTCITFSSCLLLRQAVKPSKTITSEATTKFRFGVCVTSKKKKPYKYCH